MGAAASSAAAPADWSLITLWALGYGSPSAAASSLSGVPSPDALFAALALLFVGALLAAQRGARARARRGDEAAAARALLPLFLPLLRRLAAALLALLACAVGVLLCERFPFARSAYLHVPLNAARVFWLELATHGVASLFLQRALSARALAAALLPVGAWAAAYALLCAALMLAYNDEARSELAGADGADGVVPRLTLAAVSAALAAGYGAAVFGLGWGRPALRPYAIYTVAWRGLLAAGLMLSVLLPGRGSGAPVAATSDLIAAFDFAFMALQVLGFPTALYLALTADTYYWRGAGRGVPGASFGPLAALSAALCGVGDIGVGLGLRGWGRLQRRALRGGRARRGCCGQDGDEGDAAADADADADDADADEGDDDEEGGPAVKRGERDAWSQRLHAVSRAAGAGRDADADAGADAASTRSVLAGFSRDLARAMGGAEGAEGAEAEARRAPPRATPTLFSRLFGGPGAPAGAAAPRLGAAAPAAAAELPRRMSRASFVEPEAERPDGRRASRVSFAEPEGGEEEEDGEEGAGAGPGRGRGGGGRRASRVSFAEPEAASPRAGDARRAAGGLAAYSPSRTSPAARAARAQGQAQLQRWSGERHVLGAQDERVVELCVWGAHARARGVCVRATDACARARAKAIAYDSPLTRPLSLSLAQPHGPARPVRRGAERRRRLRLWPWPRPGRGPRLRA